MPQSQNHPADRSKRKKRLNALLFAFGIAVTLFTLWTEIKSGGTEVLRFSSYEISPRYLIGAFLALAAAVAAETLKYRLLLAGTEKPSLHLAYETAVYGRYYDNITPSGIGGQPFQIYHLCSAGICFSSSAAVVLAGFLTMQYGFILLALLALIFGSHLLAGGALSGIRIATYFGFVCYALVPTALLLFTLLPELGEKICGFFLRLLSKIGLIKHPEEKAASLREQLDRYRTGFRFLFSKPLSSVGVCLFALVYHAAVCSLPYFVITGFGADLPFFDVFAMSVLIYTAVTFIPTPGNSGAAEGAFSIVFSALSDMPTFWPVLIWRGFCYYSFLLLGILSHCSEILRSKHQKKRELPVPDEVNE